MHNIQADEIHLGKNVIIDPSAKIRGLNGNARRIHIGDNTYIGADVQVICDYVDIGDYTKIHHHTNIHGYKPCKVGHNVWVGQYVIIDSIGGTTIGNNCCVGASTHLWSHIKYGDTLEGCRFLSDSPLLVGNDVWFAGHCTITPITAHDKSMALAGAVVTKDMNYNEIYAGSPAKSISDKIGYQFNPVTIGHKLELMHQYLAKWGGDTQDIKIISSEDEINDPENISYFNVADRTYNKRLTDSEISFMKFLLPEKGKFVPR